MLAAGSPAWQQTRHRSRSSRSKLEPGDAIYIPSLWWHQLEGLDTVNLMVNFWWKDIPGFMDSPFNSLMHCLLTIRDCAPT